MRKDCDGAEKKKCCKVRKSMSRVGKRYQAVLPPPPRLPAGKRSLLYDMPWVGGGRRSTGKETVAPPRMRFRMTDVKSGPEWDYWNGTRITFEWTESHFHGTVAASGVLQHTSTYQSVPPFRPDDDFSPYELGTWVWQESDGHWEVDPEFDAPLARAIERLQDQRVESNVLQDHQRVESNVAPGPVRRTPRSSKSAQRRVGAVRASARRPAIRRG